MMTNYPTNTNFHQLFCAIATATDKANPPKLLLHACCAPCATHCLAETLPHFEVTLFYSNDNITDPAEWQKRLDQLVKLVDAVNSGNFATKPLRPLRLVVQQLNTQRFYDVAQGLEDQKEGGLRCNECFRLRLTDAAQYAQNNGYHYFGTTLTVSPYKNSKLINNVGKSIATNGAALWLPSDFKKNNGYAHSIELSNTLNLYRQHYCGCNFSLQQASSQK